MVNYIAHKTIYTNMAYALIGAEEDCDWRQIPESLKQQAKTFVKGLKQKGKF